MKRSRTVWFANGLMAGFLVVAALNSVSYFVRSGGWSRLLNASPTDEGQALGFPFEIWRSGETYGGAFADYRAIALNTLTALLFGSFLGSIAIARIDWLNRLLDDMIASESKSASRGFQFSLRGMLLMTTVAAVIAGSARASIVARPELLAGIYLLGPLFLILVAMIPQGMSWEHRVVLLVPSTLLLIWFTSLLGSRLGIRFDRVMMGIFICWVPQTVGAAFLLTLGLAIRYCRKPL